MFRNINKFNYKKISKNLIDNGYYIFENYFHKKELSEIKASLLETLNYIEKDNIKDLQKKYYKIKKKKT